MRPTWRRPAFGHGRGWLHDYRGDVLVTVDPHTLRAGIHCAGVLGDPDLGESAWARPTQILTTTDAVWVARGKQLTRVDPRSAAWHDVPVPVTGEHTRWAATPDGLVGTGWPTGRVTWVRAGQPVTTRELGGHLAGITAGGGQVWIVDRTDETLLGLDLRDLHVTCRVPLHRGRIEFLIPLGDDVLISHSGDLRRGGRDGVWRVTPNGQRTLVLNPGGDVRWGTGPSWFSHDGDEVLSHRAPTVAATDGTTLWIGERESRDSGDMQRDPVCTLTPVDLATGRAAEPMRVAGQVDDLAWAFGKLWRSGFVRSRQETILTVLDPTTRRSAEVDFTDAEVGPYLPRWEPRAAPDYDAELDRLIGELRTSLTGRSLIQDQRTGQTRPGSPRVHEQFRLLDLALDRAIPAVRITFEWASEPDVRFAYEQPISIPPITSSVAGDVSVFFTEEICTGLVRRAEREHHDGFVVLRLPTTQR